MSDLYKRIITGIIAVVCLFTILEFYLLSIATIFTVIYIASEEYFAIVRGSFKKNLAKNMIEYIDKKPKGIWIIPVYFLLSDLFGNNEAFMSMSIIFSGIMCVIERLYQFSSFCAKNDSKNPGTDYLFACFVVIMSDIFFCVYIVYPFSFCISIASLQ